MARLRVPLAAALCAAGLMAAACSGRGPGEEDEARMARTTLADLAIKDDVVGAGAEARVGRRVSVHYTGWLYHPTNEGHRGRSFDSSRSRGEPFVFTLGTGEVISGWDQGVAGMKVGGRRTLLIPARLAYGAQGAAGLIPPEATLVFDIELLDVE